VYLGNFGAQLFVVGHELIRSGRRDLRLVMPSGGILLDDLIAEGVTTDVVTSHCWNPIGPARTEHFQRGAQEGWLTVTELSFGAICSALQAAASDVPFATTTDLSRTDYADPGRSGGMLTQVRCEFGEATVVRALAPDVAFLHVDCASADGRGWVTSPLTDVLAAAQASRRTVLVAEELAEGEGPATIPGLLVSAVVHAPGAVRPDGAAGRYGRDLTAYTVYSTVAGTAEGRAAWRETVRHG
jgi:glutaconate CoA-transferase subunit A